MIQFERPSLCILKTNIQISISSWTWKKLIIFLKSRIQETKHLSTDADSSTNTPKPEFFEKREKIIQNAKTQKREEIC